MTLLINSYFYFHEYLKNKISFNLESTGFKEMYSLQL